MRMVLPEEVAEELIAGGGAQRPLPRRGADVLSIVVDTINTGSALVTVVAAGAAFRRIAASLLRRRRPSEPDQLTITIATQAGKKTLTVDRTDPESLGRLEAFLQSELNDNDEP